MPTLKESGVAFSVEGWFAFYAPARTPPHILERLENAILAATRYTRIRDRMQAMGFEPMSTSSKELKRVQRAEFDAWANVIKATGFKSDQVGFAAVAPSLPRGRSAAGPKGRNNLSR